MSFHGCPRQPRLVSSLADESLNRPALVATKGAASACPHGRVLRPGSSWPGTPRSEALLQWLIQLPALRQGRAASLPARPWELAPIPAFVEVPGGWARPTLSSGMLADQCVHRSVLRPPAKSLEARRRTSLRANLLVQNPGWACSRTCLLVPLLPVFAPAQRLPPTARPGGTASAGLMLSTPACCRSALDGGPGPARSSPPRLRSGGLSTAQAAALVGVC